MRDQHENDRSQYTDTGFRAADGREGFGDDMGTRVGRPDGARPAPKDASKGENPIPGQAGTNADAVPDGLEGSILDDDAGPQQSRVRQASEGVDMGRAAGDDRRVDDL